MLRYLPLSLNWIGLFITTLLSGWVSTWFIVQPENISALWLTNACGTAWIFLAEHKRLVRIKKLNSSATQAGPAPVDSFPTLQTATLVSAVFFGIVATNILAHRSFWLNVSWSFSNAAEVILALWMLHLNSFNSSPLARRRGALAVGVLIPSVACGIGSILGSASAAAFLGNDFVNTIPFWWLSDLTGMSLVLPIAVGAVDASFGRISNLKEIVICSACFVFAVWLFEIPGSAAAEWGHFPSLIFPALVLAAVYVRPLPIAFCATSIGALAIYESIHGNGYFSFPGGTTTAHIRAAQAHCWAVIAVSIWTSAAAIELKEQSRLAQAAVRAKRRFLATMSHEVRTPITAILGMTEQILEEKLSEDLRSPLLVVHDSARGLLHLLNDILDHAKTEEGKATLVLGPCSLSELLSTLESSFEPLARAKNIGLSLAIDTTLPGYVECDAGRLRQVLTNLIGNALKFTPPHGTVILQAHPESIVLDRAYIRFSVIDTGQGISNVALEKIFKPFEQENATIRTNFGGTGLGLSISNDLVRLMGGKLDVTSTQGVGSTFTFVLCLPITSGNENSIAPAEIDLPRGLRILVAEDNIVNQRLIVRLLEKLGCDVTVVDNGTKAVTRFKNSTYDLIMMDISMPDMDGIEATKAIRDIEKLLPSRTPIVAVTAHALQGDKEDFLSKGLDGYISKPYESEKIKLTINELTNKN